MQRWDSVTIVGVGLIGASIGLALRERELAQAVVGVGRRTSTLRTARQRGAVTSTTTDLTRGVRDSQLIVVCTPVESIATFVLEAAANCPAGSIITDAGSTKFEIVRTVDAGLKNGSRQAAFVRGSSMATASAALALEALPDSIRFFTPWMMPIRRNRLKEKCQCRSGRASRPVAAQ